MAVEVVQFALLVGVAIALGWARTIACVDMYHIPADPYSLELEALDSMLPGEAAVANRPRSARARWWAVSGGNAKNSGLPTAR